MHRLTRDFIKQSLYCQSKGYFSKDVINYFDEPLNFKFLWGKWEYNLKISQKYRENPGAWLTPVEIFRPYFSEALANYTLGTQTIQSGHPLTIYEVGGGMGTNALCILDYLQRKHPQIYATTRYTIVEISPFLADVQRARLKPHQSKATVLNEDFLAIKWKAEAENPFVIALEVLDNMPHDKITWEEGSLCLKETVITGDGTVQSPYVEETRPVQDYWIKKMLETEPLFERQCKDQTPSKREASLSWWKAFVRQREEKFSSAFIPTCTLQMLHVLNDSFPNCNMIIQDFDYLPPPENPQGLIDGSLQAYNAPLVSSKDGKTGLSVDYNTYLLQPGLADIFFPVDFNLLQKMTNTVLGENNLTMKNSPTIFKCRDFMKVHADLKKTQTISGYNPILEDFSNTSILILEQS